MSRHCQVGSRFFRCGAPAIDSCQYCGRPFCAKHCYIEEGLDAVCTRRRCRAKFDDLVRHLDYKQRARQRNAVGLCGIEECGPHPSFECSLCHCRFCEEHVSKRMYPVRHGFVVVERPLSVCTWCWERRKIWRR